MSALVLGVREASFEGQGPMWLEACARPSGDFPELPLGEDADGLLRIDWSPLLPFAADQRVGVPERAGAVHEALADAISRVAGRQRESSGIGVVGLTGGVFQNRLLRELSADALERHGFRVLLPEKIPANDGGLGFGQVAEYLGRVAGDTDPLRAAGKS
jgi:hydrogenase maturation protein HypF